MFCVTVEELPVLPGVHLQLHPALPDHLWILPGGAAAHQQVEVPRLWHSHPQGACQPSAHDLCFPGMLVSAATLMAKLVQNSFAF